MIKLKPLLTTESIDTFKPNVGGRSISVSDEKGNLLLNTSFNSFSSKPYNFFRKTKSVGGGNFTLVVPGKIERTSKDTANFYYVLFDNLPSWKGYPSRSKAVIFTNNSSVASEYSGILCKLYPINNAKIAFGGYTGEYLDLPYMFDRINVAALYSAMARFEVFFQILNDRLINKSGGQVDLPDIKYLKNSEYRHFLDLLDKHVTDEFLEDSKNSHTLSTYHIFKDIKQHKKGNWESYFDELFNPLDNKIKILTGDNFDNRETYEFWTTGACLLKRDILKQDIDRI